MYEPEHGGDRVDAGQMRELVSRFLEDADRRRWNPFRDVDWKAVQPDRLTEAQRMAVVHVSYVEDHIPGYFSEYGRGFPVDDSVDLDSYLYNRELYRFTSRWTAEEEVHAQALYLYQEHAAFAEPAALREQLAAEGRKKFSFGFERPLQVFTYTLLQEKLTQLYYRQLGESVGDPVLARLMTLLSIDEARHYSFFVRCVQAHIVRLGAAAPPLIREVVEGFHMPLQRTMKRYWWWASQLDAAVDGRHRASEAFRALEHVTSQVLRGKPEAKSCDAPDFLRKVSQI